MQGIAGSTLDGEESAPAVWVVSTSATRHDTRYATRHDIEYSQVMSVRHALLALLSEGPKYGLQLREEFEARTGEIWPLNVGQVYSTLQRLERDGLVESDGSGEAGPQKGNPTPAPLPRYRRETRQRG